MPGSHAAVCHALGQRGRRRRVTEPGSGLATDLPDLIGARVRRRPADASGSIEELARGWVTAVRSDKRGDLRVYSFRVSAQLFVANFEITLRSEHTAAEFHDPRD